MITAVITSAGRHDLLKRTLESYQEHADLNAIETFIVEDSPADRPGWLSQGAFPRLGTVHWVPNRVSRGQVYSIDRAYELVRTPYVMHLEDDWKFLRPRFLNASVDILEACPDILQVLLGHYNGHPVEQLPQYPFQTKTLNWREGWSGFSWNPGLRRISDWHRIGSYGRHAGYSANGLAPELGLSRLYAELGYRVGCLPDICTEHLGNGRSVAHQPHRQPSRTLIIIPACHEYKYTDWEADIHVSGPGQLDRLKACRETWLRDVAPHSAYLDYKFFYGQGAKRAPLPDEVFLDVDDTYRCLPQKVAAAFTWAWGNGYKRVIKCDDDSYLWVDRMLRDALSPEWENVPYYGFKHLHGYVTGGASYILTGHALSVMASTRPMDFEHWAEDHTTNRLLGKHGISGTYHMGHQPGFANHWYNVDSIDSAGYAMPKQGHLLPDRDTVPLRAIHAVRPDDMRTLYSRWVPCGQ